MAGLDKGKICYGQLFNEQTGQITKYSQQAKNVKLEQAVADFGSENVEISITDANAVVVKTFDVAAKAAAQLVRTVVSYQTQISFDLPAVLTGLTVVYNSNSSIGEDISTGTGGASGSPFQLSLGASARSSGSASIIPEIIPAIKQYIADDVKATGYEFYLANGFTAANLLTKLTTAAGATVNAWPVFKPELVSIYLGGQSASLAANAEAHRQKFISDDAASSTYIVEQGYSSENGVTIRTKEISPTLHAAITPSGATSQTAIVTASANASWTGSGVFDDGSASSNPTNTGVTVTGGTPSPNGSYTRVGNYNGYPFYVLGAFSLFRGTSWKLQAGGLGVVSDYWQGGSGNTPDGTYAPHGANTGNPVIATATTSYITITASIYPTTIPATIPTTIPTSGLYLKKVNVQPDDETGNIAVVAIVVNMSIFA